MVYVNYNFVNILLTLQDKIAHNILVVALQPCGLIAVGRRSIYSPVETTENYFMLKTPPVFAPKRLKNLKI